MKTLFVLSDTHGNKKVIEKLLPVMKESDFVIHLGDFSADIKKYAAELKEKLITVDGNCDFFGGGETERIIQVEGVKIFCCHGHKYGVKRNAGALYDKAEEAGAQLALFGHTHSAVIEKRGAVTLVNPGCMTNLSAFKSYVYIIIKKQKILAKIVEVKV